MISIIGAGKVGSASAFNILRFRISDVVLIDIAKDFSEMEGSEVVVMAAGAGRRPGMTRFDLMSVNAKIVKSAVKEVVRYAPECKLMVVTNPVDVMTYIAYKESGFERNRVFGMGNILDTMRFRSYIASELTVSREDIRALVVGEHGDSMVPLVDYATVSGIPIKDLLEKEQIEKIVNLTRTSGADVIKLKGATTYAPAVVIAIIVDAVLRGRNRVVSVSTFLQGEYGLSNISIGVPVILGRKGVERILELRLSPNAKKQFMRSASIIKDMMSRLENL